MHKICINFTPRLLVLRVDKNQKKVAEELAKEDPNVISNGTIIRKLKLDETAEGTKVIFFKEQTSILKNKTGKQRLDSTSSTNSNDKAAAKRVHFKVATVDDQVLTIDRHLLTKSLMKNQQPKQVNAKMGVKIVSINEDKINRQKRKNRNPDNPRYYEWCML